MPKPLLPIRTALVDTMRLVRSATWQKWFQWTDARMSGDPGNCVIAWGSGDPNGVRVGIPGDLFVRTNGGGGTTLYVKESGVSTNTGWVGK